jgi:hypothetical protein
VVFQVLTPYNLVGLFRRFGGPCLGHLQIWSMCGDVSDVTGGNIESLILRSLTLKMKGASFSKTSITTCRITQCHNPEYRHLKNHCLENLKTYITNQDVYVLKV